MRERRNQEDCRVWREGERERSRKAIKRENEDLAKVCTKLATKHLHAELCVHRPWGALGIQWAEIGWGLLLAPLCLALSDYLGQPSNFAEGRDRPREAN